MLRGSLRLSSGRSLGCYQRCFHTTTLLGRFKTWKQLADTDKRSFVQRYVDYYKDSHPCSKSNVMYRSLAEGMDEHDDVPYVFGIIYNEVRAVALGESKENKRGQGILGDPNLEDLLIK